MAAAVFLTFAFLICKAQSQIYGQGVFPGQYGLDPGPCGPCASENYAPYSFDPYGNIPGGLQNIVPISQPIGATIPCGQPLLNNLAGPSFIQNQIPPCNLINQPLINNIPPCSQVSQPIFTNIPQLSPSLIQNPVNIPQLAPSIIQTPIPPCSTSPVVTTTVVDNTLANSLANAIQLLIVSNLIENKLGSCACGNSLLQSLGLDSPCVNNFEVLSCECPVPYTPCCNDIPCLQESVVYQSPCVESPCNSFGSVCGSNSFGIETCSNLFGSPVIPSFGCAEPAIATIAPMAVEVPFPASIPAQLTCNFGYMPTNVPCVSVNVEPLPFDGCNNLFGNFGNFIY